MGNEERKISFKPFTLKEVFNKNKTVLILLFITLSFLVLLKRSLYNRTESMATGLYVKKLFPEYVKGRIVTFEIKDELKEYLFPNEKKEKLKNKMYFVKRIVGVPNDKIVIKNKELYVNGISKGKILTVKKFEEKQKDAVFILGKDEYFVMGDSPFSFDSRYYGVVNKKEFKGEVFLAIKSETVKKILGADFVIKQNYKYK